MDTLTDYLIEFGHRPDEAAAYKHGATRYKPKTDRGSEPLSIVSSQDITRIQQAAAGHAWDQLIVQGVEVMPPPSPDQDDEEGDD